VTHVKVSAATSLAASGATGAWEEARDLPICAWFTEGFDAPGRGHSPVGAAFDVYVRRSEAHRSQHVNPGHAALCRHTCLSAFVLAGQASRPPAFTISFIRLLFVFSASSALVVGAPCWENEEHKQTKQSSSFGACPPRPPTVGVNCCRNACSSLAPSASTYLWNCWKKPLKFYAPRFALPYQVLMARLAAVRDSGRGHCPRRRAVHAFARRRGFRGRRLPRNSRHDRTPLRVRLRHGIGHDPGPNRARERRRWCRRQLRHPTRQVGRRTGLLRLSATTGTLRMPSAPVPT